MNEERWAAMRRASTEAGIDPIFGLSIETGKEAGFTEKLLINGTRLGSFVFGLLGLDRIWRGFSYRFALMAVALVLVPAIMLNFSGRALASSSIITTVAGNGTAGYSGDGGPATSAELDTPLDVALDSAGNLYIADTYNFRIRKVDPSGNITTVAGGGSTCCAPYNGVPATSVVLAETEGIALDTAGNLYIADISGFIYKVNPSGIITTVAGSYTNGYAGDGGPATSAEFDFPSGIAVDAAGDLYISDFFNDRVRRVDAQTGIITTVAGNGSDGYSGDGGPATSAELYNPAGIAVDAAGNLYIADSSNDVIRKVNAQTGIITTVAGGGICCSFGDGGQATSAELGDPSGVAVDAAGNLYIGDVADDRVRKVDTSGIITTVAGTGKFAALCDCYSGDGGPATSANLYFPWGVAVDATGDLYIADSENHRIRKVTFSGATGAIQPQTGLWIVDAENNGQNGRGFQLEEHSGTLVMTYYGYLANGSDHWYLSVGSYGNASFSGAMEQYLNGTALGGAYQAATDNGSAGNVSFSFSSATAGTVTFPGEAPKAIEKFAFSGSTTPSVVPDNGLWIINAENNSNNGRGFQIEQHGGALVFTYYGYDNTGNEVWYLSNGTMSGNTFTADLVPYTSGPVLGGSFTPAVAGTSPGSVTLTFSSPTAGTIQLPGEATEAISKFAW